MTTLQDYQNLYYIINKYKNNNNFIVLLKTLSRLGIAGNIEHISAVAELRPELDPNVEAIHILAFVRSRGHFQWTQDDYIERLEAWWARAKRAPGMEMEARNPKFRLELHKAATDLDRDVAGLAEVGRKKERNNRVSPETLAQIIDARNSAKSPVVLYELEEWYLLKCKEAYKGEDLSARARKFFIYVGYRPGMECDSAEWQAVIRRCTAAFGKGLLPEDLQLYIFHHYLAAGAIVRDLREQAGLPNPTVFAPEKE